MSCDQNSFTSIKPWQTTENPNKINEDSFNFKVFAFRWWRRRTCSSRLSGTFLMSQRRTSRKLISASSSGSTGRWVGSLQVWVEVRCSWLICPAVTGMLLGLQGRNAEEQVKMIQQVEEFNASVPPPQRITVSVEIEKTREPLYRLFPHADVVCVCVCACLFVLGASRLWCFQVFVSKDVARHFGFLTAEAALRGFYPRVKQGWLESFYRRFRLRQAPLGQLTRPCPCPRAVLICAWGEKGADALGPDGALVHSDAFPPESLVDTLGAGDTFNAAVIYTLSNGETSAGCCSP